MIKHLSWLICSINILASTDNQLKVFIGPVRWWTAWWIWSIISRFYNQNMVCFGCNVKHVINILIFNIFLKVGIPSLENNYYNILLFSLVPHFFSLHDQTSQMVYINLLLFLCNVPIYNSSTFTLLHLIRTTTFSVFTTNFLKIHILSSQHIVNHHLYMKRFLPLASVTVSFFSSFLPT